MRKLDRDCLDLVVMSQIMALMTNSTVVMRRGRPSEERQQRGAEPAHAPPKIAHTQNN